MRKVVLLLLICALFLAGCKKDDLLESINYGYEYYPLSIGDSAQYEVEKITWNDFNQTIDTSRYFLCEYVESATMNNAGDSLFRIEQWVRESADSSWEISRVDYAFKTRIQAFRVDNNVTYVKLVFPFAEQDTWDGNLYNALGEKKYKCTAIGPVTIENRRYENSVTITQEYFVTLINSDIEKEVYAKGVGLVERSIMHVDKTYNPSSGLFQIKSGYTYLQKRVP